jgi:flagellar basal-body rod modification protein FlgD
MIAALEPTRQGVSVTQASSTQASGTTSTVSAKDQFLQLLVTQLQHQDPLNPMDGKDFTAQLAQFSLLEQAVQTNSALKSLNQYAASVDTARATGMIGKTVRAKGDSVTLGATGGAAVSFNLGAAAAQTTINLYDSSGSLVRTLSAGALGTGAHSVQWDGKNQQGNTLSQGTYQVQVVGKDSKGNRVGVTLYKNGKVDSVQINDGVPLLMVGGSAVALGDVVEVSG